MWPFKEKPKKMKVKFLLGKLLTGGTLPCLQNAEHVEVYDIEYLPQVGETVQMRGGKGEVLWVNHVVDDGYVEVAVGNRNTNWGWNV